MNTRWISRPPQAMTSACGWMWKVSSPHSAISSGPSNRPVAGVFHDVVMASLASTSRSSAVMRSFVGPGATRAPGSDSSISITVRPLPAAAMAADRPATPAPTTSTSGCQLTRSRWRGASLRSTTPSPAILRIIGSIMGHANFGLMPAL